MIKKIIFIFLFLTSFGCCHYKPVTILPIPYVEWQERQLRQSEAQAQERQAQAQERQAEAQERQAEMQKQ